MRDNSGNVKLAAAAWGAISSANGRTGTNHQKSQAQEQEQQLNMLAIYFRNVQKKVVQVAVHSYSFVQ
jgi:hypothetical protein